MINRLIALLGKENVLENESLKNHTTFKVGGPSKAMIVVNTKDELIKVVSLFENEKITYMVIGNGSNLLVSDEGFDGFVIKLSGEFLKVDVSDNHITAGAGAILSKVCTAARDNELSGLEFAYGIPGTVGGAMVMNAGAYDGEMSFVVESVDILSEDGQVKTYSKEEMCFGYRDSVLKHMKGIVLCTVFALTKGDREEISAHMADFLERRKSKQPLEHPSAGSTFKRPEGYFAGKLIQDAGLSGKRVGGASVSTKHCGFVVNDENGTAKDIDDLMKEIIKVVKDRFSVDLEPEVIKIGSFGQEK